MGRRKIVRTFAEEEDIKRARNDKKKANRCNRRNMKKKKLHCHNDVSHLNNLNSQNVDDIMQNVATPENTCPPLNSTVYDILNNIRNVPSTSKGTSISRIAEFESRNPHQMFSSFSPSISSVTEASSTITNSLISSHFDHNYCYSLSPDCITSDNSFQRNDASSFTFSKSQNQFIDHDYCRQVFMESTIPQYHFDHDYSRANNATLSSTISDNENLNHNVPADRINVNNVDNINIVPEHYIGEMIVKCRHCSAKHFTAEKVANKYNSFNDCCRHGEVNLGLQRDTPELLKSLFSGTHEKSKNFFECIRNFNNSFSFASFNANLTDLSSQRRGPYCFKIQGQIYYQVNTSLYPSPTESPNYGQLFIVDANEAAECRSTRNINCDVDLLRAIDSTLRQHNVFAKSYQMMKDVLQDNSTIDLDGNVVEPELNLIFSLRPGMDARRYNFQRVNEIAAVFSTTADGEIPESYITVQNKTTKSLQFLSTMDPNTEPWVYPLFYPYGNQGWHKSIPYQYKTSRTVTRADYFKYQLATRDHFNIFLMGRRLTQQWVVDSYVKIEKDRLNYCKFNQKKLRAESYQGLIDHLRSQNTNNNTSSNIGKIIILPSSFYGSPRNMMQHYQDAMSIVRQFGKPDLFVTMTCNPKWREITENLLPGQTASDRPDLVARIFDIKKDALINMIVKQHLFGQVAAYNWVIEFQKRSLPHLHMLITLECGSKITTPEQVDRLISAEIPNPNGDPILFDIVTKNMLHGPCGNWCLINNVCSKKFPKYFRNETTMDGNGYPYYRRRNEGITFSRNNFDFDNQYVVPYNATLLKTFNCHINVEVVSSIRAVKYLYKYVYKGHDKAGITINGSIPNTRVQSGEKESHASPNSHNDSNNLNNINDHDEVRNFVDARYVGPVEAVWRILSKNLQNKSHAIIRLPVHLPNEQSITISDDCNNDELQDALQKGSMLIDYFKLNKRDPNACQFTYGDIPCHYVFKRDGVTKITSWQPRKKNLNVIGRMYSISPAQVELFHLRLLLVHIKGAKSFDDLKTINGIFCDTFTSACLAAGLIEDDQEWRKTLNEAIIWMMPRQLRCLFVRVLIHCQPLRPEELWNEFKGSMSEDYTMRFGVEVGEKKAYIYINSMLNREGYSLSEFPSMIQITEIDETLLDNILLQTYDQHDPQTLYDKLNVRQKEIVDFILNSINSESISNPSNCIYIDGPGGSGKTFIYTTLYQILRREKKIVCTMAYTGIAATLLPNGKTVHKTFGLPVPIFSDSSSRIKPNSKHGEYLKSVDVFILDEAPMSPRYALEIIDRTLRHIMNNETPFGGKLMILGGDFRQLLPVQPHATRSETVNLSIKFSSLWNNFRQFSLTQNMRALPEEIEFVNFLLNIGDGTVNNLNDEIILPDSCNLTNNNDIVENVYGRIIRDKRYDQLTSTVILSARNLDVDEINKRVVEILDPSTEKIFTAVDSTENCDNGNMDDTVLPEYLNTLNPPNFPPYALQLRQYAIVMLIRNLNLSEGLCNGTRLMILELGVNVLRCKILTGDKAGEIVSINRLTLYCENTYPFTFKRRQFPIRIAFCMTINKAQGQTFEKIGVDLIKDVFNHGQLYVAFSRVRSWSALQVSLAQDKIDKVVKNIVYKEIFS